MGLNASTPSVPNHSEVLESSKEQVETPVNLHANVAEKQLQAETPEAKGLVQKQIDEKLDAMSPGSAPAPLPKKPVEEKEVNLDIAGLTKDLPDGKMKDQITQNMDKVEAVQDFVEDAKETLDMVNNIEDPEVALKEAMQKFQDSEGMEKWGAMVAVVMLSVKKFISKLGVFGVGNDVKEVTGEAVKETEEKMKKYEAPIMIEGGVISSGLDEHRHVEKNGETVSKGPHFGVDIKAQKGTPIKLGVKATLIESNFDERSGNYVKLKLEDGRIVTMAHLNEKVIVEKGTEFAPGDDIAQVGSTGKSTGPHLHLELTEKDGTVGNPYELISSKTPNYPEHKKNPFAGKTKQQVRQATA